MKRIAMENIAIQDDSEDILPSSLQFLTTITIGLAAIGLLLGLFLLSITWDLPLEEEPPPDDEDPLPNYGYFFRFLGIVFTVFALAGLIGGLLIYKRRILGWFSLVGVYASGFLGCIYILFLFFQLMLRSNSNLLLLGLIRSPIPYLMILGGCALIILFHKKTIYYIFRN